MAALTAGEIAAAQAKAELIVAALDDVAVAASKITNAIEDRGEAIHSAYRDGVAVPAIAKAAGLTRGRVYQILGTPNAEREAGDQKPIGGRLGTE